jgi:IPT/TIG domain
MRALLPIALLLMAGTFVAADDAPQINGISPKNAKPGDVITIEGLGLGTRNIDEVYLTDHKFDMKVKVLDQKDKTITLRVPPFAKPGRMQLLVLTKGEEPKLLEQPVFLLIEDPNTEIAQKQDEKPAPEAGAPEKSDKPQDKAPEKQEKPVQEKLKDPY